MDFTWAIKYATEFLGTAILVILSPYSLSSFVSIITENTRKDHYH